MFLKDEKSLQMNDLAVSLDVKPEMQSGFALFMINAGERWFWRDR
jgi:hypothetical protein